MREWSIDFKHKNFDSIKTILIRKASAILHITIHNEFFSINFIELIKMGLDTKNECLNFETKKIYKNLPKQR